LNEAILGHHALQHSTEDLVQFVDSLDLIGDSQVDQALWSHHKNDDLNVKSPHFTVSVPAPVSSVSDAIPLIDGMSTGHKAVRANLAK
jgi:hypothetical protein